MKCQLTWNFGLILARKRNISPSLAIAQMTRGRGIMAPNKLKAKFKIITFTFVLHILQWIYGEQYIIPCSQTEQRTDTDCLCSNVPANLFKCVYKRNIGILKIVRPHKSDDGGDAKIGEEDNQQCQINAEWNRLLGILGLLP